MKKRLTGVLCALMGAAALLALLCTVTLNTVLSSGVMNTAFGELSPADWQRVAKFGVSSAESQKYADAIVTYLSGNGDVVTVTNAEGIQVNAFEDDENRQNIHMSQVRDVISFMKIYRYIGGGIALAVFALTYVLCYRKKKSMPANLLLKGFADGSMIVLSLSLILLVWGLIDFEGLFYTLHLILFPGTDAWLLDWDKHLLMALMPRSFFTYYAKKLLVSVLPILGIMVFLIIARFKLGVAGKEADVNSGTEKPDETKKTKDSDKNDEL